MIFLGFLQNEWFNAVNPISSHIAELCGVAIHSAAIGLILFVLLLPPRRDMKDILTLRGEWWSITESNR